MLDQLKSMAMEQMAKKMLGNSLGATETNEAASEGAGAFMEIIQNQISSGNLSQVTALFSGGGDASSNGVFNMLQGKLSEILQSKGMSAEEAQTEAQNTAPDLINSLKDKFMSTDDADKAFDLGGLASMVGGDAGDVLNKMKNLF